MALEGRICIYPGFDWGRTILYRRKCNLNKSLHLINHCLLEQFTLQWDMTFCLAHGIREPSRNVGAACPCFAPSSSPPFSSRLAVWTTELSLSQGKNEFRYLDLAAGDLVGRHLSCSHLSWLLSTTWMNAGTLRNGRVGGWETQRSAALSWACRRLSLCSTLQQLQHSVCSVISSLFPDTPLFMAFLHSRIVFDRSFLLRWRCRSRGESLELYSRVVSLDG